MKYNVEIANLLDKITSKLKWNVAVRDNGKTMWVYNYDERKRESITSLVNDILANGCITDLGFGVDTIEKLCSILPKKKDKELAIEWFVNNTYYVGGGYKNVRELTRDQLTELKQYYYMNEKFGDSIFVYYSELADIDELVTDEEIFEYYNGTLFVNDDFACSCGM